MKPKGWRGDTKGHREAALRRRYTRMEEKYLKQMRDLPEPQNTLKWSNGLHERRGMA
jgi:hypothetical protein